MKEFEGRFWYDEDDIVVGEIYKRGRESFLVKKVSFDKWKVKNYGEDREENPWRVVEGWRVHTTKLSGDDTKTYVFNAGQFDVKFNQDKFNRVLKLEEDVIEEIENKENVGAGWDVWFDKEGQGISISVEVTAKGLLFQLVDWDKGEDVIASKKVKELHLSKKYELKAPNGNKYSVIIQETYQDKRPAN